MEKKLDRQTTLLLVPANDAEAVQIIQIATKLNMETIVSDQPHGARLDHEEHLLDRIGETGKSDVAIVEMPGPATEKQLASFGVVVHIIDHHRYDDLDRMTDPETGLPLLSSLEQFLDLFSITDDELKQNGFDPRLVRGVGAMDRGFIWALQRDEFSPEEIKKVSAYVRELSRMAKGDERMQASEEAALLAWKDRKQVGEYILVTAADAESRIRGAVSLLAAEAFGKPVPMIIVAKDGDLIYVQETPKAFELFKKYGGFTFGQDMCWGHDNTLSEQKVSVEEVLEFLK